MNRDHLAWPFFDDAHRRLAEDLGAWSAADQATGMAIVQLAVITLVAFVVTAPDGVVLPTTTADWLSIGYMALFAGALAMVAQTWAQAHLAATRSAIMNATGTKPRLRLRRRSHGAGLAGRSATRRRNSP